MRWETQMEAVHMPASMDRIGFDRLWRRLGPPTAMTSGTSNSTAGTGTHARAFFIG